LEKGEIQEIHDVPPLVGRAGTEPEGTFNAEAQRSQR
jgi:hypothetical protein